MGNSDISKTITLPGFAPGINDNTDYKYLYYQICASIAQTCEALGKDLRNAEDLFLALTDSPLSSTGFACFSQLTNAQVGIIRNSDGLGRVVIPMEIRKYMNIGKNEPVMLIPLDETRLLIQKHTYSCLICDSTDNLKVLNDKHFCYACSAKITAS